MPLVASLARARHVVFSGVKTPVSKAVILRNKQGDYLLCPLLGEGHAYLRAIELTRNGQLNVIEPILGVVSKRIGVNGWFARLIRFNDQRLPTRAVALVSFEDGEYRISLIHQESFDPCLKAIELDEYSERMTFVAKAGLEGTVVKCRVLK